MFISWCGAPMGLRGVSTRRAGGIPDGKFRWVFWRGKWKEPPFPLWYFAKPLVKRGFCGEEG